MKRLALLIGVNEYDRLTPLSYARADAEAFGKALVTHCGFAQQDILLMTCASRGVNLALSSYIEDTLAV